MLIPDEVGIQTVVIRGTRGDVGTASCRAKHARRCGRGQRRHRLRTNGGGDLSPSRQCLSSENPYPFDQTRLMRFQLKSSQHGKVRRHDAYDYGELCPDRSLNFVQAGTVWSIRLTSDDSTAGPWG